MSWQTSSHLRSFPNAIVHIDGDAFFASCEQAVNPKLKGKPVITGKERGIAASMSYEAKRRGVKRGMRLFEVKQICPDAVILPNDYETYSLFSKRMFEIMRRFTNLVEEYSIDEGFADITGLRRPLNMSYEKIAKRMKKVIEKELNITVSVGLAPTKSLAKIASDYKKPSGFVVIRGRDIQKYLRNLPVDQIWGVGQNTARYMMNLGIYKAGDFINKQREFVERKFTKPHQEIWWELNGELVYKVDTEPKTDYASISKTKTFTPASCERDFVFSQLMRNVENACIKLRRHKLAAKKLVIFLKTQEFQFLGLEAHVSRASAYPHDFLPAIEKMFDQIFIAGKNYRATGITLSGMESAENLQLSLFEPPARLETMKRIYEAVDSMARKFGKHTLYLGGSLQAMKFGQHLGARGDVSARKLTQLPGEFGRRRLAVPMLMYGLK